MELARLLMRIFSYVYHGLLAVFMVALSLLALQGGAHNLRLEMLPWKGATLTYALLGIGLFAIVATLLALKGVARVVFFIWTIVAFLGMFRGFFLTKYAFGPAGFRTAILMTLGALVAAMGGWFVFRQQQAMKRKY